VVNLGNALARAGFVAMFHWSPTMTLQHNIDLAEQENLVWAFQFLASQEFVDPERVGLGGFCVGASFSLVAAADPRIRDEVKFVNAFGPYFDAEELLLQIASRSKLENGQRVRWDPDQLTLKVFANELIETLVDNYDIELLTRLHLKGGQPAPGEVEQLSPHGQVVNRLLQGTTLEEAGLLYNRLPAEFRRDMRTISPKNYVDDISARLLILHDRDDRLVPAAESRRLAVAFKDRSDVRYTEVLDFDHVRPNSGGGVWQFIREGAKLYRHMYSIMRTAS
jgi:dienelactone hydrolase